MAKYNNIQYRSFKFAITQSGQQVAQVFVVDDDVVAITGIALSSDRENLLWYRGTQEVRVSGDEIFPRDYESKRLQYGVDSTERYFDLGEAPVPNRRVEVNYVDWDSPAATFAPYTVTVNLRLKQRKD